MGILKTLNKMKIRLFLPKFNPFLTNVFSGFRRTLASNIAARSE
jgi:hypothetical protein